MIKKIIEISQARTHLSIRYGQLVLKREGEQISSIPCEDVGVLLVDHRGITYTHSVFTELLKNGAAIVLCGENHHPSGMFLPIESNSVQTERYRNQIEAKEPVKKRLWQQIIRVKIRHQAKLVKEDEVTYRALKILAKKVRSGDPDNIEARVSKKFWNSFFEDESFRRDINGPSPNNMLNYGYMVMRAAVARAICSAGLLPSLGLHHRNRYNAFCLADDVLEPFRGFVEARVKQLYEGGEGTEDLGQYVKARLLDVLYEEVNIAGFKGPLMVGLHRTAASLYRVFAGEQEKIELPKL